MNGTKRHYTIENIWAPVPAIRSNAAPAQRASLSGVSTAIGGAPDISGKMNLGK